MWRLHVPAGFDAQDDAVPTTAVGIHHPHGNIKRISYVNNSCVPLFLSQFVLNRLHMTVFSFIAGHSSCTKYTSMAASASLVMGHLELCLQLPARGLLLMPTFSECAGILHMHFT